MSTLGDMVSQIETDLDREDLTQQINESIDTAITYYSAKNFLFSESRERTFDTVAGQYWYSATDVPDIGNLIRISRLWYTVSSTVYDLKRVRYDLFEMDSEAVTSQGQPYEYTYYGEKIGLYPAPNKAYQIRFQGDFITPAPSDSAETGNAWFTSAYEMIRCRAKYYLHAHVIHDDAGASKCNQMARDAMMNLKTKAHRLQGDDRVYYSEF